MNGSSDKSSMTLKVLVRRLVALSGPKMKLSAATIQEMMQRTLKRASRSMSPSQRSIGAMPPQRFMGGLGQFPRAVADLRNAIKVIAKALAPGLEAELVRIVDRLSRINKGITRAVGARFIVEYRLKYSSKASRVLTREQFDGLLGTLAGRAAEATVLASKKFGQFVARQVEEVSAIAADAQQLKALSLKSLDPTPLVFSDVRTAAIKAGAPDARQPFVDLGVVFRGVGVDGKVKYLAKALVQSKLDNVADLIEAIKRDGSVGIGQLARDELRGDRGPWYFERIRIERDAIIKHPGLIERLTLGTADLTQSQHQQLLIQHGISVTHLLHSHSRRSFYRWAEEFAKALGIRVK